MPAINQQVNVVLQMVFAQVAGPLTWSIVALRNSLVLHSLDKVNLASPDFAESVHCALYPAILALCSDSA